MNPHHGPQQCERNLFCLALGDQGEGILFWMLGATRFADSDERNRDSVRSHFLQTYPRWSKKRPRECQLHCIAALSSRHLVYWADHAAFGILGRSRRVDIWYAWQITQLVEARQLSRAFLKPTLPAALRSANAGKIPRSLSQVRRLSPLKAQCPGIVYSSSAAC
jgi:hypothetical protein